MRVILINLILLMLPLVLYWLYMKATGKRDPKTGDVPVNPMPIFWLIAIGAVLMFSAVLFQIDWDGAAKDGDYVPPRMGEDGKIIPGHMKPKSN